MAAMQVPLIDLSTIHSELRPEIDAAIASVVDSGRFIGGPELTGFEEELATACGTEHAIGVSSGTDALLVALMALGVGPGDEVITSAFTFFATAGVIARLGAKPVFVDIESSSFNADPSKVAALVGPATKAYLPVNIYGRLADIPELGELPVIEDAAQSIGTGAPTGLAACYSFFPTKNVGAFGDAGAVVSSDDAFADRVRLLRTHGGRPKYFHAVVGGNFRMDAIQAAVLRIKLRHMDRWNQARRSNAASYRELFAASSVPAEVVIPEDSPEHIYHQFTLCTPKRDELRAFLMEQGVGTEIYYPKPLHLQECFADLGYRPGSLPNTERAADEALSLPIHQGLTAAQLAYVVEQVDAFFKR